MPTQCWNGNLCKFKPKCQFYHPEGGNKIKTKRNSGNTNDKQPKDDQINDKNQPVDPFFWKKFPNNKFLDKTDYEDVEKVIQQQVTLLGSDPLYQRIHKNLQEHTFDAFFANDQFKLFAWREEFFYSKFGHSNQRNSSGVWTWYTDGCDDAHGFDTVPYQITKNFDNVMALACSPESNRNADTSIYFECDEILAADAQFKFNTHYLETVLEDSIITNDELVEKGMSFNDVSHMIVAMHRIEPYSLLEAAMKAVLLHDLPIQDIPKELQKKARDGLYSIDDSVPTNLDVAGQNLYRNFIEDSVSEELRRRRELCD